MAHILDQVIAGKTPETNYAVALRLPRPSRWEPGRVWIEWDVTADYLTPWGAVFGGYLAALADESAGLATLSVLEEGEMFGTTDLRLTPLRAVRGGRMSICASVVHRGRSLIFVEVEFRNHEDALLAKASASQVVRRGKIG